MPVWKTFRHSGIAFPPAHDMKEVGIVIGGRVVSLSPLADEMAYNFARKKDTPYVKDPVFVENFMKYFANELPTEFKSVKFSEIDFSLFYGLVDQEKRMKETMTKDEKKSQAAARKVRREEMKEKYGKATIDGKEVEIANWLAEPPGLFMGRGAHPLRGSWKPRVDPAVVTLNLDASAPRPEGWKGKVVCEPESIWIAKWIDKLTGKEKYVWPHEGSEIQQSRNKEKYDKALRIGGQLEKLRRVILKSMSSRNARVAKTATVCYLIDRLGMRVGDEKDEDEADTVGATTLRVEHIRLGEKSVEFDFLGKDSVSGDTELYYRLDGQLNYSTFEELLRRVTPASYSKDSEGRELVVPSRPLEVLTANDLDQRKTKIEWGPVSEIITHEVRKAMFELSLAGGRQIRVTGDHSLFIKDEASPYFAIAAPVHLMSTKDSIATVSSIPVEQPDRLEVDSVPITDDLLTFCGLWLADGCYGDKSVIISAGSDTEVLSFVDSFSVSYSDKMKGHLERSIDSAGTSSLNNYQKARARSTLVMLANRNISFGFSMNGKGDIWCHSVTLMRLLQRLQLSGYSGDKDIPEWVHTLSGRQIGRLLCGYFSGDGCVPIDDGSIRASSISKNLLEHVRVLLLRLGVDSVINREDSKAGFKRSGPGWVLSIGRDESKKKFASRVGFLQKEKNARIRLSGQRYKRFPIAWRRIRKIAPVQYYDRVYDLSVEGTQRFIANGLLAHNSVRWVKTIVDPEPILVQNLKKFTVGKKAADEVFDVVTSSKVNQFLSGVVPGASAKVFRTYHATKVAEDRLRSKDVRQADELEKKFFAKEANLAAAVFCNHKRTPPKNWDESLKKKEQKLEECRAKGKESMIRKMSLDVEFTKKTKDYNLSTSLKNYIDPRVYKTWCDSVGLDWSKLYTTSLQRKFSWVAKSRKTWDEEQEQVATVKQSQN
jgi:DNA topoisomerase IB